MKYVFGSIIVLLLLGFWFPIIPFPVQKGWHGVGGEFCGIVYNPDCSKITIKFLTYKEIINIVQNHEY